LVIGIDGLGYDNLIKQFSKYMTALCRLCRKHTCIRIPLDVATSPRNWVRIFAGVDLPWYNLYITQITDDRWRLVRRYELPVKFIWDIHTDMVVINAPVVCPPYCKNTGFRPVAYGMGFTIDEWISEINSVTLHARMNLSLDKNVVACYTVVDRMLHVTAYRPIIEKVLTALDMAVANLIALASRRNYRWIIVSDHGMKRTSPFVHGTVAPRHDMPYIRTVLRAVHQHDSNALLITNVKGAKVKKLTDVYKLMLKALRS